MFSRFISLTLVVLFVTLGSCVQIRRVPDSVGTEVPRDAAMVPEGYALGKSATVDGATIFAVTSSLPASNAEYVVLDEGISKGWVSVTETGVTEEAAQEDASAGQTNGSDNLSGDVNRLYVSNSGSLPLFLMAGDLVLGGKQDRILAESLVVAPNTKNQPIPVYCVEHGRWTVQDKDAGEVSAGKFYNKCEMGQVDLCVKGAALDGCSQSMVWDSVSKNNSSLGVEGVAESGTFRSTFEDGDTRAKIDERYKQVSGLVDVRVVGFAMFVGDEMIAMDILENPTLCAKVSEKLLRSYVVTSLSKGYERGYERMKMPTAPDMNGRNLDDRCESPAACLPPREDDTTIDAITVLTESTAQTCNLSNTRTISEPRIMGEHETQPNDRTANTREYKEKALTYSCTDKETGKCVQRSFMRR